MFSFDYLLNRKKNDHGLVQITISISSQTLQRLRIPLRVSETVEATARWRQRLALGNKVETSLTRKGKKGQFPSEQTKYTHFYKNHVNITLFLLHFL